MTYSRAAFFPGLSREQEICQTVDRPNHGLQRTNTLQVRRLESCKSNLYDKMMPYTKYKIPQLDQPRQFLRPILCSRENAVPLSLGSNNPQGQMKEHPNVPLSRRNFIKNTSYTAAILSAAPVLLSDNIIAAAVPRSALRPPADQSVLRSHSKSFPVDPSCPFPVGVEYYRPPQPPTKFWDEDFKRIRATGLRIVRSFSPWGWFEPSDGKFVFDEIDLFFDLAAKHGLKCWWDTPVGTHFSCPDWLLHKYPDMRVVWSDGTVQHSKPGRATVHGVMTHNFDHPMWRVYVERFVTALVSRYKDHPSMHIWGTWDGINFAAAWAIRPPLPQMPPYNDYTIERYRTWLKERYTLDRLNDRLGQRYQSWDAVDAPRGNEALVEMLMYRKFHYENMADHLGWLTDLIDRLDGKHEQRAHGAWFPRQWDEICSPRVDSWGLSMPSDSHLTSNDPYSVSTKGFGFQWARAIGRNNRWWNEEIYSNYNGGISLGRKKTLPEEDTIFLWLSLIEGAAGALYWQYRPEYSTFEGPGLNLVTLDGRPTPRLALIQEAIGQINTLAPHFPLTVPKSDLAIAFSAPSMDVFNFGGMEDSFQDALKGIYRAVWPNSIPQDIVTPSMDWSNYKAVCLPNFALLDETAVSRLREVLGKSDGPTLVIEGHFGTFAGEGHWSYLPPEKLSDLIGVRIDDFDFITPTDIQANRNILSTKYGNYPIVQPCQYAILKPGPNDIPIATIGADVVGVQSANGRVLWFGVPLVATGTKPGNADSDLILNLLKTLSIKSPISLVGDRVVAFRRRSKLGGSLIFLLNLERRTAKTTIAPGWKLTSVTDLINKQELALRNNGFQVELPFGQVGVFHCHDS